MRRRPSLFLSLLLFFVVAAHAQLKVASPQELGVIKVLLAQERSWNEGNIDAFASAYKDSPDTLFIGSHISRGFAEMLNEYRKNYPSREAMGTLGFSELEVHPLDEKFVVVLGHYHLDRSKKAGGPASGIFSLVFENTPTGWKIVVDHTT
jgi:ketosteroid isomerase-like protein